MTSTFLGALALVVASSSQVAPEVIYSRDGGPIEMCGLAAPDIASMRQAVRDAGFTEGAVSPEFVQFMSAEGTSDVVFSTPAYFAHPLVTCRDFVARDGALFLNRQMRCDADRASCDAALQEFNELDAQMISAIQGQ